MGAHRRIDHDPQIAFDGMPGDAEPEDCRPDDQCPGFQSEGTDSVTARTVCDRCGWTADHHVENWPDSVTAPATDILPRIGADLAASFGEGYHPVEESDEERRLRREMYRAADAGSDGADFRARPSLRDPVSTAQEFSAELVSTDNEGFMQARRLREWSLAIGAAFLALAAAALAVGTIYGVIIVLSGQ